MMRAVHKKSKSRPSYRKLRRLSGLAFKPLSGLASRLFGLFLMSFDLALKMSGLASGLSGLVSKPLSSP